MCVLTFQEAASFLEDESNQRGQSGRIPRNPPVIFIGCTPTFWKAEVAAFRDSTIRHTAARDGLVESRNAGLASNLERIQFLQNALRDGSPCGMIDTRWRFGRKHHFMPGNCLTNYRIAQTIGR